MNEAVMHPVWSSEDWSTLRVGVLGLGRSGLGAVSLLRRKGARVRGFDDRPVDRVAVPEGIEARLADAIAPPRDLADLDALVVSPGVEPSHYVRIAAERMGLPVLGEIELASHVIQGPVVAITGTNGKSTTASWLHHCLRATGRTSVLGGNIGVAASEIASQADPSTTAVLEVSSFQLETIDAFHPRVAMLLNLAPDHLDRYASIDEYVAAKRNILRNATEQDWFVTYAHDETGRSWSATTSARTLWFSDTPLDDAGPGAWVEGGVLRRRIDGPVEDVVATRELRLLGRHNLQNAAAVVCAGSALGLSAAELATGLVGFDGLRHRSELVTEIDGVRYVNDSKATNVHATTASLAGLGGPLVLLLGGRGKGEDYRPLREHVAAARVAVCYGEEGPALARALDGVCPTRICANLSDAVTAARQTAQPGDVVLLSPACASYDEFGNFEERGDAFVRLVRSGEAS